MPHYVLNIVKRKKAGETVGWVSKREEFDAPNDEAAKQQGRIMLEGLNWDTHFAGLASDNASFLAFWASEHA